MNIHMFPTALEAERWADISLVTLWLLPQCLMTCDGIEWPERASELACPSPLSTSSFEVYLYYFEY